MNSELILRPPGWKELGGVELGLRCLGTGKRPSKHSPESCCLCSQTSQWLSISNPFQCSQEDEWQQRNKMVLTYLAVPA